MRKKENKFFFSTNANTLLVYLCISLITVYYRCKLTMELENEKKIIIFPEKVYEHSQYFF